jgi:major membrane immunogen (membrane-anchored lipoprotein)
MKKLVYLLVVVFAVSLTTTSCGSSKYGTYKVKKKGCMTKTKYKGPRTSYRSTNW